MNNIQIALDTWKEDLRTKKLGTALGANEPAVISLPIQIRPFICNTSKGFVFAQCKTYNAILNNQLQKFPFQSMLPLTFPEDRGFFDLSGYLSSSGKLELWTIINRETRRWEHQSSSNKITSSNRQVHTTGREAKDHRTGSSHGYSLEHAYHNINIRWLFVHLQVS